MTNYRHILLCILSASLFSPIGLANTHTVTVFQCVNKNQKKVNISLANGQYIYQFGKLNQKPDITMVRKPEQLAARYLTPKEIDSMEKSMRLIFEMATIPIPFPLPI